jgi:DNA-binding protein HU-beta
VNKNDLVNEIASHAGLTKARADEVLKATLQAIMKGLKTKGAVRLVGFGSFEKVHRKKSTGRNPRTGAPITIPASNQIKFRPGKLLKDHLN